LSTVSWNIASQITMQNIESAKANFALFTGQIDLMKAYVQAVKEDSDTLIGQMDEGNAFWSDAQKWAEANLGLTGGRVNNYQPALAESVHPPPPKVESGNYGKAFQFALNEATDGRPASPAQLVDGFDITLADARQILDIAQAARP
jgi:hypothetical protein